MINKPKTENELEGLKVSNRCELAHTDTTSTWNLANSTNQWGEGAHGTPHPPRSRQGGERHRSTQKCPRLHNRPLDVRPNHKTWQNQASWRDCPGTQLPELQEDHQTEAEHCMTQTRKNTPSSKDPISTTQTPDFFCPKGIAQRHHVEVAGHRPRNSTKRTRFSLRTRRVKSQSLAMEFRTFESQS